MPIFYQDTYTVDTRDVDTLGHCRPSALLGYLQEAASMAAVDLHIDRAAVMEKYNVFWMVARIWYTLNRPLRWNEKLTVKTWHRGGRAATMYRDFDLRVGREKVGEAVSIWVLADCDTHKLAHLSKITEVEGTDGGNLCKEKRLPKLSMPSDLRLDGSRRLHYSDTDINGHINNARYADFLCDALRLDKLGRGRFVTQLQLGYLAECLPGQMLTLHTAEAEGRHYVRGTDNDGVPRFDGFLSLSPVETKP